MSGFFEILSGSFKCYLRCLSCWVVGSPLQKSCLTRKRWKSCSKNTQTFQERLQLKWKKNDFGHLWQMAHKNQSKGSKKDSLKCKHGLMLSVTRKIIKKPPGTSINLRCSKNCPHSTVELFMSKIAYFWLFLAWEIHFCTQTKFKSYFSKL